MPAITHKKANLVFPSDTLMANEDLVKVIKETEKGPFYTVDEVKQALKKMVFISQSAVIQGQKNYPTFYLK